MKFNPPGIVLWDEMDTLRREDFPPRFPSEVTSQVPVKAQGGNHLATTLSQGAMSTCLSGEAALFIFLLFLSLD